MITASRKDKSLVIEILTKSFVANQSVNYLIPQDSSKTSRIRQLMDYSFELCLLFGKVLITADRKACALILFPELKQTTLRSIYLDVKLIVKGIGFQNISKALTKEKRMQEIRPNERMTYLWFIGVEPASQHQGIGKRLMEEITAESMADHRAIYLETSTLANVPWYTQLGFETYAQLDLGYLIFFLRNVKVQQ